MSKETFKLFAKSHPELAAQVMNGKTNWQKLYELFEIYGEDSDVWTSFTSTTRSTSAESTSTKSASFKDLFNTFKNIDLDSVQKGVTNLQKTIGLLQDIGIGGTATKAASSYEPRPMYKYFED